jgi:DNA-binding FrmR family transcriptional regulator
MPVTRKRHKSRTAHSRGHMTKIAVAVGDGTAAVEIIMIAINAPMRGIIHRMVENPLSKTIAREVGTNDDEDGTIEIQRGQSVGGNATL